MTKPNFLEIFSYDTATENHCRESIATYRNIAQSAFEQAGESLLMIAQRNPTNVELEWSFIPKEYLKDNIKK